MTPYYYRIQHTKTGMIYIGCQFGKNANPHNLLTSYFTSSKRVQAIIAEEGVQAFEIRKVVPCKNARMLEKRVLKKLVSILGKAKFVELFLNRTTNPAIMLSDEERIAVNKDPLRRSKIAQAVAGNTNVRGKRWWNDGAKMMRSAVCPGEGWVLGALPHTDETKQKRSAAHRGKKISDETKQKMSAARLRPGHNGSHKGTKWIVDQHGNKKRVKEETL